MTISGVSVRPVLPADADAWVKMRQDLWPEESPGEHRDAVSRYLKRERREPRWVLLAVSAANDPLGFAELSIRNIVDGCETDRVTYLEGWYVVPGSRRHGVGRALLRAAEDWGREQGSTEFGSDTELENDASAAAHQALGFTETGKVRTFRKVIGR